MVVSSTTLAWARRACYRKYVSAYIATQNNQSTQQPQGGYRSERSRIQTHAGGTGHLINSRHRRSACPRLRRVRKPAVEEVIVTGIRGSLTSSMELEARLAGCRRRHRRRGHRQVPGHESRRIAAAHQRRVDRSLRDRRRLESHGARRRPGLQPGVAERPADARRPASRTPTPRTIAPSISPISLRKPSPRSRCTRPAAPARRPAASARRSTSRPRGRSTTRDCAPASASRASSIPRRTTCPDSLQGDSITPEISGIFSNTFADDKFGVAISASYQERDLGFNQAVGRQRLAAVRR